MLPFFLAVVNMCMQQQIFNLERDIRKTWWMVDKIRQDTIYAQNLYAAFCNHQFASKDIWGILANKTWNCSWRYAAVMVAEIHEDSDYTDWYCSGIKLYNDLFVPESFIVPAIETDLAELGWVIVE